MKNPPFAVVALALLAACGGSQPFLSPGSANAKPPIATARLVKSWMAAGAENRDLLYVSNVDGLVNVYRYWQHTLVGVLTKFQQPMGECVDGAGNVYITDWSGQTISEYAHGAAKALRVIPDSYKPYGCAVDPKTGNLAVANYGEEYSARPNSDSAADGNLAIYIHAKGQPTYYGSKFQHFSACAYDKYGDLLAASSGGYSGYYSGEFDYLPAKSKNFAEITLPGPSSSWYWYEINAIAWDGEYWVVDAYGLYRYSINIEAQYVDTISLSNAENLGPIWIYRKNPKSAATQLVATGADSHGKGYLTYWKYPSGGSPIYQTSQYLDAPYGVAASLKQ
jgi:DNA-binding beta-propeller fold protein YncE